MLISLVDEVYKKGVKDAIMYCFNQISEEKVDRILDQSLHQQHNCIAALDGEKVAGCVLINPYRISFDNQWVGMGGIGLVSTLPEYRNQRFASQMMIHSLEIMREREQYFSVLGPFSIEYYRKLGWELCFEMKQYTLKMDHLKGIGNGEGVFRPLTPRDNIQIKSVFERFSSNYNGVAHGNDRHWYWRDPTSLNSLIRYGQFDEKGKLVGYLYFSIKDRRLNIKEMAYVSNHAKKKLLHFIYSHRAQATEINWVVPPDDNTFMFISNPAGSLNQTITGKMLRVVDVQRVLELMDFDKMFIGSFTIKVEDPWLSWNQHTFCVSVNHGKARVKTSVKETADIYCTIQTFSQISIGYISLKEAVELEKISVNHENATEIIDKLFLRKPTYINEQF